jgi:predicted nuclease of predicted toxin-antitoxin system
MVAFLAEECFSGAIIRALREAGFDATRSADLIPAAADQDVLELAVREQRVLLTEDNDFGELTMRLRLPSLGIVRIDLKSLSKQAQARRTVETLAKLGDEVCGAIVSIEPGRARIRKIFDDR